MRCINKAILIGRLGNDPEVRYTQAGQAVASFRMATDESYTDKSGEKKERTEWHNVVAWAKLAEICGQYLKKGRLLYAEGRLQTRQWEGKDGGTHYTTEIVLSDMSILESKTAEPPRQQQNTTPPPPIDDDIPF